MVARNINNSDNNNESSINNSNNSNSNARSLARKSGASVSSSQQSPAGLVGSDGRGRGCSDRMRNVGEDDGETMSSGSGSGGDRSHACGPSDDVGGVAEQLHDENESEEPPHEHSIPPLCQRPFESDDLGDGEEEDLEEGKTRLQVGTMSRRSSGVPGAQQQQQQQHEMGGGCVVGDMTAGSGLVSSRAADGGGGIGDIGAGIYAPQQSCEMSQDGSVRPPKDVVPQIAV